MATPHRLRHHAGCAWHEFQQSGATYLFDLASAVGLPQEDRTIAAWTLTPAAVAKRDGAYQRGFPLAPRTDGSPVDRGHVIPHLSGGEFGPNIFRQDRALNRGWSEQGKRYRALEREAAERAVEMLVLAAENHPLSSVYDEPEAGGMTWPWLHTLSGS